MYVRKIAFLCHMCLSEVLTLHCRLSEQAQNALESVGSSYVKQISFRDAWAFIGRSQIHGFSPFEEVLLLLIWVLLCIWTLMSI